MILDKFENWNLYSILAPEIMKAVFNFLKTASSETENKRYDICGNNVYALVQQYNTLPVKDGKIEAHRKYIDIQVIISGEEFIGISKLASLKELSPYNPEKDYELYENSPEQTSLIKVAAGDFMILFPEDGHMPCISANEQASNVKKVVVKVSCQKFFSEK